LRALVLVDIGRMEIRDIPDPSPKPGWALLRVSYCGICGSDLGGFLGRNELRRPPLVMGHEFTGEVVGVGPGVPEDIVGGLYAVNPIVSCGRCSLCRDGLRNLCYGREIIGVNYPGAFAEYVLAPYENLYPVRDPLLGALAEPLAVSIRAVRLSEASPGDSVLVLGAGSVGSLTIKVLRIFGVRDVVAVDVNRNRLELARALGASAVLTPGEAAEEFKKLYPRGFDAVIETVGAVESRRLAVESVRRGGRVVLVGLHDPVFEVNGNSIVRGEIEVKGSFAYTDRDFSKAVDIVNKSPSELEGYRSRIALYPLTKGEEAFREALSPSAKYVKYMIYPGV